ncbi:DUF1800 domain-containing protein [Bryobacter aggregatus]|uniref:DUF1800 domain-containing protein n=1 Tax=Bryobacter aggregatus TaxID=360054 RepID=UPI00069219EF|nr:DUF1800 domain-containing protein [Bryobacter aggregatus]
MNSKAFQTQHLVRTIAVLALLLSPLAARNSKKPNEADAKFREKLAKEKQGEHALSRLSFGPRPQDREKLRKLGLKKWIELQLNPTSIPENPELLEKLAAMPTLLLPMEALLVQYPTPQILTAFAAGKITPPENPELRETYTRLSARYKPRNEESKSAAELENEANQKAAAERRRRIGVMSTEERNGILRSTAPQQAIAGELTESKLYRAVLSERQLHEVLVDFWFNHFNVYLDKGADHWLTTAYEREAIRPFVLGHFQEMLLATAESPAMLFFLDNWQSVSEAPADRPRKTQSKRPVRGLNENYARELMELHTLGVDGGYTQKDVQEVARCFTGWTIEEPNRLGKFKFNERVHDKGEKLVLGVTIPAGGGIEDGIKVIEILAKHPATARFLSRKLAQRFVADEPPKALVERMAASFLKSEGDLKVVMRTMLNSPEFFSAGAYRAKMKSPLEVVAAALRATEAKITNAVPASQAIANMGQPLYRKQEPTGYSNNSEEWVNSAGLLARMNFAIALSNNKINGVSIDKDRYAEIARSTGAPEGQRR